MNPIIKFPLNFQTGLGWSPAAGPPVGGLGMTPGQGFYGQSLQSVLPNGSNPTSNKHFFGRKKHFGYPLMNLPSSIIDEQMFPKFPVGKGDTSGGNGGVFLQGMPGFDSYWGFGKRRSKRSKRSEYTRV